MMAKGSRKKRAYPEKRTMNLYYKPDRTTFPATVALYVMFVLALLLAFGKYFVYDILMKYEATEEQFEQVEAEKNVYDKQLAGYDDVLHRYQMYSSTAEEDSRTDRMEVLRMLDEIVRPHADLESVSIAEGLVSLRFSGVTLSETAEIVRELDSSPLVARTTVSTAATVENLSAAGQTAETDISGEQSESAEDAGAQAQSGDTDGSGMQVQSEIEIDLTSGTVQIQSEGTDVSGAENSDAQAQNGETDASGEQAQNDGTDGSGEQAQSGETEASSKKKKKKKKAKASGGQTESEETETSAEQRGNPVTANVLIALQKESESREEETDSETAIIEP